MSGKTLFAYKESILSIFVNTLLFGLKLWAGIVSGSVAITADAWHTLSDSLSSMMVLIGAKLANKPADKEHPYGHGRMETVTSFFISIFLGFIAYHFLVSGIHEIYNHITVHYGEIAIVVTVISILLKEALAQYAFYAYKKTQSMPLKADAWHHRSDALSSLIILTGIFLGKYFWWIDGALSILVSASILYIAIILLSKTIHNLLGETPDEDLKRHIETICTEETGDSPNVHHIQIHNYINHIALTFHIHLDPDMNLYKAHGIATNIEKRILEELNMHATIHIEPHKKQP